ncbi:MAG: VOC family protein [Nitrososphaeraceae archaeon]|nr:VOC family protein [Nitrososphaeraceae archaeon]MDW0203222.1 VOC family protein [Nitrososphaeraceae archaeon]MDW0236355.1 VOC family protein [Nitrososphaeraceae archaeon]MDW0261313.1 VOC family protein [Nitrososphaeraceae archaeon]MDW0299263.1 VOC family protein [Nitrososphaeraceae archaeon]
MNVYKISAVTLLIKDMHRSCNFYSKIPGFKLVYGGPHNEPFTTYEIGKNSNVYLNLEQYNIQDKYLKNDAKIILYTEDVDKLYTYFKNDQNISKLISFENEPIDASWGERYFHIRDPDGHLLSFAKTITKSRIKNSGT